jgi:hypothetical protein
MTIVFAAHSAETAYLSPNICAFAFQEGVVPIDPFMCYGYFLWGMVAKDAVRNANDTLVKRCDELWVFGVPSDGVDHEIALATQLGLPIRYFELDHYGERIVAIDSAQSSALTQTSS